MMRELTDALAETARDDFAVDADLNDLYGHELDSIDRDRDRDRDPDDDHNLGIPRS